MAKRLRVSFTDAELKKICRLSTEAGLTESAFVETAALKSHIAPKASENLIDALRNLYDLGILLNDTDKALEEKKGLIKDLRKLIRDIEKEYFSNY